MEQYGNEHFNVERVIRENINGHEYMRKRARSMTTWEEVIDEVYTAVDHVEPWMSGNIRGPSSAFCLLYRLFELKLTEDQIQDTITSKDSVYIRAIGFLYLRYVCAPANLLSWLEPHFADETKFWPSGEGRGSRVTMGAYVRDLVLCQNYFETIFVRIPKKIHDEVVEYLQSQDLPCKPLGNGGQGGADRRAGDAGRAGPSSVKASLSVAMGQRSGTRNAMVSESQRRANDGHAGRGDERDHRRTSARDDRDGWRDREHDRDRDRPRPARPAGRGWPSNGEHGGPRERERGGYGWPARPHGGRGGHGGGYDRAPANSKVFGRSAADVFGKATAASAVAPVDDFDDEAQLSFGTVKIGRRR